MNKMANLKQKIKSDLGIEISNYGGNDLLSKINDILFIQKYAISNIIKPLGISILLYILGFFILNLSIIGYAIYGLIGLVCFIILAICFGVFSLLNQLKNDIVEILKLAINPLQLAVNDLSENTEKISNQKNPLTLIFEGIIFIIITPQIFYVFNKIPFIGKFLSNGSEKILGMAVNSFRKQEDRLNLKNNKLNNITSKLENINSFTEKYINTIDKTLNKGINILKIPFKIPFVISLIILSIIIFSFI